MSSPPQTASSLACPYRYACASTFEVLTCSAVSMPSLLDTTAGARVNSKNALQADEPDFTRNKVRVFLSTHTCYELIPESGKVVILDVGLPIRQAFHALHEQVSTQLQLVSVGR